MKIKALLFALLMGGTAVTVSAELVDMEPSTIVAKYGKPDRIQSTENNNPKPFFITRVMEYKKAGVRVMLLANDKQPPYIHWKLMGYQDMKTNKIITVEEFESRIQVKN